MVFAVGASGTAPLNYQWTFNGANLQGATAATLTLTNVSQAQAGSYAVQVTNAIGSILSSNAVLAVNPPPACTAPPAGLVSWWQGEGNAGDETGLNNASLVNGVTFAPGMVGQAFSFSGNRTYIEVPDSPSLDITNEFTVELWYKDTGCPPGNHFYGLMTKRAAYPAGTSFGISLYLGSPSYLQAYLRDTQGPSYPYTTCALPQTGLFHHVAATYSQATPSQVEVRIYVDGQLAGVGVLSADLATTQNTAPITIGADDASEDYFVGLIDEPAIYSRALSAAEILAIYNAGVSGKCATSIPVALYSQPASQTVVVGQTAAFTVGASGTAPLSYQWSLNGSAIPGATNNPLVLTNVQAGQAGNYSVHVTNAVGSATSSNALLTVNFAPASVLISGQTVGLGGSVTLPVLLVANGNENALGFSLAFSPGLLSYVNLNLGPGAAGATLVVNTNQAANGQIGVLISMPANSTFAPGTQDVVEVSFLTAFLTNPASTTLTFGDQPTTRQLSDPQAHTLAATFTGTSLVDTRRGFRG